VNAAVQATDTPSKLHQDAEALASWLHFGLAPGVGRRTAAVLVKRFGTPQGVQQALAAQHSADAAGDLGCELSATQLRSLCAPPDEALRSLAARTLEWAAQPGNRLMALDDPHYPPLLRQIDDPPLLLHIKGNADLLHASCFAIVGSRNATVQGKLNAEHFAQCLADVGLTIVSGLARGIDAAAHRGGLRGRGASIAVIATGADRIYPRANAALAHQLAQEGCIVSEFPLGAPPCAWQFPVRNRIISGLSRGVLVVEAATASGSLVTANSALAQDRDVFAIPGSIHSSLSRGCHRLLRDGAMLVETIDDVLHGLGMDVPPRETMLINELERAADVLLDVLSFDPLTADALARHLRLDAGATQASLLALELAGLVERLPGGVFRRLRR
jgi:DNA processing protein